MLICSNDEPYYCLVKFVMHIIIIVALWFVFSRIDYFRKVFSM